MKLKTTTSVEDIKAQLPEGVSVEIDVVNSSVNRIAIKTGADKILSLARGRYGDVEVSVPQPKKKVKRFKLSGKHKSLPMLEELFEYEYEAVRRSNDLDEELGIAHASPFVIEEVEVEVDDD